MVIGAMILAFVFALYLRMVIHMKLWKGIVYAIPLPILLLLYVAVLYNPHYLAFCTGFVLVDIVYHISMLSGYRDFAKEFVGNLYKLLGGKSYE